MKHLLLAGACALVLTACATPPGHAPLSLHQQAEVALISAIEAYNTAAAAEKRWEATAAPADAVKGHAVRTKGLLAVRAAHTAYNHGQVPDTAAILAVVADLNALKGSN